MFRRVVFVQLAALLVATGLTTAAAASGPPSFSLPDQASEVAPGVFFLGHAVQDGVAVVGYAYARFAVPDERGRRGNAKPPWAGGGGGGGGEEETAETCYSYIAKGAKWNTAEGYLYNPANINVASTDVIEDGIDGPFRIWETAAGAGIVGLGTKTTETLVADTSSPDKQNEIYFASIPDQGVLGYTIVWYTRSRGRNVGQIVESDMVIDDAANWSWYTGSSGAGIDFWSVLTHEAGHWVGMGHTKSTDLCATQTMYPSISAGDSSKRDLGVGDEAGISALY